MSISIVNDALKFYDQNNEKYHNIKKRIKYIKFAQTEQQDIEGVKLIFFDENKKELFVSRVEILGKYYTSINTWVWGWSLASIEKSLTAIIRKVFLYGTDIDINNNPANILLKNELITSRFRVEDNVQIDIHCAIASYLAKKPFIFLWREFMIKTSDFTEVKGEFYGEKTDVTYYTFIVDPPDPGLRERQFKDLAPGTPVQGPGS
jgi:hypothetical protein